MFKTCSKIFYCALAFIHKPEPAEKRGVDSVIVGVWWCDGGTAVLQ